MNKQAFLEALKSLARVLLFAAVGWGVSYVTSLPPTSTTLIVLSVLKVADKYIHANDNIAANGLVPF